jgi:hypothetical protein
MTVNHIAQPETVEVKGAEAEELLSKLNAPLGDLGQFLHGLSLEILAQGGSVKVIPHKDEEPEPQNDDR